MELYWQLPKDARRHRLPIATRARHILSGTLTPIELTEKDYEDMAKAIEKNWEKIRRRRT